MRRRIMPIPVAVQCKVLGSRVLAPLRSWMFVSYVCCVFCR